MRIKEHIARKFQIKKPSCHKTSFPGSLRRGDSKWRTMARIVRHFGSSLRKDPGNDVDFEPIYVRRPKNCVYYWLGFVVGRCR